MSTVLDSIVEGVLEDVKAREIPLTELYKRIDSAPVVRDA